MPITSHLESYLTCVEQVSIYQTLCLQCILDEYISLSLYQNVTKNLWPVCRNTF